MVKKSQKYTKELENYSKTRGSLNAQNTISKITNKTKGLSEGRRTESTKKQHEASKKHDKALRDLPGGGMIKRRKSSSSKRKVVK